MSGRTVSLVGFHGSGKSTIGRLLAGRLKWNFKDTDAILEDLEKATRRQIVEKKGEDYLADLERRIVLSTPMEGFRVLAVGAWACTRETLPHLNRLGPTVHLDLTFQEAVRRSKTNLQRAGVIGPAHFGLYLSRKRFYSRASNRVWTEGLTIDEVLDAILRLV